MKARVKRFAIGLGMALASAASLVGAQPASRLVLESEGRLAAASLGEVARRAQGLYVLKSSFSGLSETLIARSGAAPAGLIKWGQLRNPAGEGFLTISPLTLPGRGEMTSAGIQAPFVRKELCRPFLEEMFMIPDIAGAMVSEEMFWSRGGAGFDEIKLAQTCERMEKAGIVMIIHLKR